MTKIGFVPSGDGFTYSEPFMEGAFTAEITVSADGRVSGRVTDGNTGDDYLPVRMEGAQGTFVGAVREEYRRILEKIADACFVSVPFVGAQANRIAGAIREEFGETPEFPFVRFPGIAVFRRADSRKWYALVTNLKRKLVTGEKGKPGEAEADVIDVKVPPERVSELLGRQNVYPGYHMNRKNWVSVFLDGSFSDEFVFSLIRESRELAVGSVRKAGHAGEWIVPANPRYYDVEAAFREPGEVIWKQGAAIRKGDTVFLYVTAPVSAVRYRCRVTETDVPFEYADGNVTMKKVMKLVREEEYPPDFCTFSTLRELGINAVRGARTVTKEFSDFFRKN